MGAKLPNRLRNREELHKHIAGRGLISNVAFGLTDGLVTNLAFLAGFAGGNYGIPIIRFAGAAAMLAGAVSMFFGAFLAARSEYDLFHADVSRESHEIEHEPDEEKEELRTFYLDKGLSKKEADIVVNKISADKQVWLQDLLTHELHIHPEKLENPYKIAGVTGLSFLAGAFVPLAVYLAGVGVPRSLLVEASVAISLAFLFVAGAWKGKLIKRRASRSGLEMLGIGAVASLLLYLIGTLLAFV